MLISQDRLGLYCVKGGCLRQNWIGALQRQPIIAAIREEAALAAALTTPVAVVFLLSSTLTNVEQMVQRALREERAVFVHLDLIEGLTKDQHGLRWLAHAARPTGIITTRASLMSVARSLGLATVQRMFLLDSQSVRTGLEMAHSASPDVVEVLPGILPEVITDIATRLDRPVIAGGMITSTEHCLAALRAGARGVSTSNQQLWGVHLNEDVARGGRV
jgi:glycerol uptake operon antiterminator